MATFQPEIHNPQGVLDYYDNFDIAGYSVYAGHKIDPKMGRYTYTGNDKNEGREQLTNALNAILQNPDNINTYCLAMLGQKGKKVEEINSISFQLNKRQSLQPYNQMGAYQPNLMNEINALRSEIAALKMQQDMEDEEEEEPEEENFLSGFMKSPQMQSILISQLGNLFAPNQKVTHVAGIQTETMTKETEVDNEERIYEAVERLKLIDDQLASDLELLCEMGETDKMQFNFLLKMLRK